MSEKPEKTAILVSGHTVRRIRYGVIAGHFLILLLVLTGSVVAEWLNTPEETITVQFYDPSLDNIVENPSPDPDPSNPVPPSGTQDGGAETETLPEPPEPEQPTPKPPKILTPEPVQTIAQPQVTKRSLPKPAINKTLPKPQAAPKVNSLAQPKVSTRRLPRRADNTARNGRRQQQNQGSRGPRGSNSEPGHTAPGGQRGNSGYDIQVALMIKRMWVTPDSARIAGRTPRVLIELRIAPDGRVVEKRIRTRSGVHAMDDSIASLLDHLHRVRPPFDGKYHTLVFWLKAEDR